MFLSKSAQSTYIWLLSRCRGILKGQSDSMSSRNIHVPCVVTDDRVTGLTMLHIHHDAVVTHKQKTKKYKIWQNKKNQIPHLPDRCATEYFFLLTHVLPESVLRRGTWHCFCVAMISGCIHFVTFVCHRVNNIMLSA